jgi:hypothetical protein
MTVTMARPAHAGSKTRSAPTSRRTTCPWSRNRFADVGIPIGGLFTGADDLKSAASARRFGGSANLPFDACYHKLCDTPANVDVRMLGQMADAAAVVAVRLAN